MKQKKLVLILLTNIIFCIITIIPGIIISMYSMNAKYIVSNGKIRFQKIGLEKKLFSYVRVDLSTDNPFIKMLPGLTTAMPDIKYNFSVLTEKSQFFDNSFIMESKYNLENEEWGGIWIRFVSDGNSGHECDFSEYRYLTFWVKAKTEKENPKSILIELKYGTGLTIQAINIPNDSITPNIYISTDWKQYKIDLTKFGYLDLKVLRELCVVYSKKNIMNNYGSLSGILYYDGIEFIN